MKDADYLKGLSEEDYRRIILGLSHRSRRARRALANVVKASYKSHKINGAPRRGKCSTWIPNYLIDNASRVLSEAEYIQK